MEIFLSTVENPVRIDVDNRMQTFLDPIWRMTNAAMFDDLTYFDADVDITWKMIGSAWTRTLGRPQRANPP